MANLEAGDRAPDFHLPRDGGGTLTLSDLAGRPVVLYFYPADNTPACTAEAVDFSRLKPEFEKAGAVVIGLSPTSPENMTNSRPSTPSASISSPTRSARRSRPMGCGWKRSSTAAAIWASSAPPS